MVMVMGHLENAQDICNFVQLILFQCDPAMTSYKRVKPKPVFTAPLLDGKTKECSVTCRAQVEDGLLYSGGGTSMLIQRTASTRTGQITGQASESQQVRKWKRL